MRPLGFIASGIALATMAACTTVGPDYRIPEHAAIQAPGVRGSFLGAAAAPVSQQPVPDGWWRLYHDPVLDTLEQRALAANTDLRVAAANLARAQAVLVETRAASDPHVGVSAAAQRGQESGEEHLLPVPLPVENLGDTGLRVTYQVDLFGRLRRAAQAAAADAEAGRAGLELAQVSVAAEVAAAYVEACSAAEDQAVAERMVRLHARSLEVVQRLDAAGRGTAVDVARARAQLEQARAAPPVNAARRRAALYRLALLTGRPPAEYPREAEACLAPPTLAQPLPVGDGAALLARRPDVRQAERVLAGATARIGVATAALYPSVSVGLSAGSTGLLTDIGERAANHWSIGSLVSWTFPDGGERARVRQADASAQAALARFDGVVLNALREVETQLSWYAQDLRRNEALRASREQAALAAEQARRLYESGRSPYLASLDADRSLASVESALAASEGQIAADQVKLFLALGGGWGTADASAAEASAR